MNFALCVSKHTLKNAKFNAFAYHLHTKFHKVSFFIGRGFDVIRKQSFFQLTLEPNPFFCYNIPI